MFQIPAGLSLKFFPDSFITKNRRNLPQLKQKTLIQDISPP
ncbi:hypothetical protein HMPREF0083_03362 [Aneurinibacillus aneurinilyticus ATCC 12856]|uniref:Uncharacterized protein n=1 Tax=Aneurinibacillus aneurinilyticus ATCC 12856 TaxID=649747 RepID=U1WJ65_ANEAE|nr:hypothetical protein HMPREF0083_03362 [Aneurinibacillus aneurinilyticus ATCC 12856]